jgi:hypothetical protein
MLRYDFFSISIIEDNQVRITFCNNQIASLGEQFISIIYSYKDYADKSLEELKKLYLNIKDLED